MVRRRLRLPDHYHPGRAGHPRLDQRAGVVQWQGGPGRLLLDRREPAETRRHRPSGAARLRADELRRGCGRHPGCGGIEGLLLPRRRSHDPDMGAVVWPVRVRQRPKLPAGAEGHELARIFRQYSVTVPDFRSPEYAEALEKATLQAPSGRILRRMGSPLTGYETFMASGPASPAWKVVDLINASHTGAA